MFIPLLPRRWRVSLIRSLALYVTPRRKSSSRARSRTRPRLEVLEDRLVPSGFQSLYSFTGGNDGSIVQAGVAVDSSGNLYGGTKFGGANGSGTVYKISPGGTFTTLYNSNGGPAGTPLLDGKGNLFDTTEGGGTDNQGTVFKMSTDGKTYTTLHNFTGSDGSDPEDSLVMDSKGDLFGTTYGGGGTGYSGTVFELSPNSGGSYTFQTLHAFSGSDGINLISGLLLDSNGNLYGQAAQGTTYGFGTVYELSPNTSGGYSFTVLHTYTGGSDGRQPVGGLIMDSSGNLYGTTEIGNTVFELNPTSKAFTTLFTFNGSDGDLPQGNLLMDAQGNLYGTTTEGTASNAGTVFELSPNGKGGYTLTNLYNFSGGNDGSEPFAGVTAYQGNLYGTTSGGGTDGKGTVFEITGAISLSSTTTTASNATAVFNTNTQNATLQAQVTSSDGTVNEGTVTFTILQGSTVIGTATTSGTVTSGQASVSYALPAGQAAGPYTIDAVYNPGSDFSGSSDNTHSLTITPAPVVTTANDATLVLPNATSVTLTAAVADTNDSSDTVDDGTVTFTVMSGQTVIGTSVKGPVSGGQASATFAWPAGQAAGSYTIAVSYGGSQDFTDNGNKNATLTVQLVPAVTTNPSDETVIAGQTATFTAAASGNPIPTVQWQLSTDAGTTFNDIAGATSATLTVSNALFSQNGDEYRAVFTNLVGSATSNAATLTVQTLPAVTTDPSDETVIAGQTATFTAAASGNPTPTVQWQLSTDAGTTFNDIAGATSTTLTLTNALISQNGDEYRAVFNNLVGSVTTTAATLTVQVAPAVTTDPSDETVIAGQTATFTAAASGNPTPTVQWQLSTDAGTTFNDIAGATSTTLTLTNALFSQNGDEYRAVFTNSLGSATSNAATLTVQTLPAVTTDPSDETVIAGQTATFTAAASGNPTPTVQWQLSTDAGTTFNDIAGATSTTLTVSNALISQNGDEYRAVFTNLVGSATSNAATLTVQVAPTVTTNPSAQTVTAGQTATFTAAASGNPTATVQWQLSTDGGKTFNAIAGATSATLTVSNALFSQNGDEYRAVFTNIIGSATSSAATLTVQTLPVIISVNSAAFTAGQGGSFTLTVTGSPTPLMTLTGILPRGVTFTDHGNGTATLAGTPAAGTQGTYYVIVAAHNGVGSDFEQNLVLTVNPAPMPPSPPQVLALKVPPLLALINGFLNGTETINANGTETVTYSLFGFTLIAATYDSSGNFVNASLFGFMLPNWVWDL